MAQLKVYGVNLDGVYRGVVAATSRARAAKLLGVSFGYMRGCGSQTWNNEEIEVAMREPGICYKKHMSRYDGEYIRMESKDERA